MAATDSITFPAKSHTHSEYMKNNIQKIDITKYIVSPVTANTGMYGDNYIITFDKLCFVHFRVFIDYTILESKAYTLFKNLPVNFETNSNFIDFGFYGSISTPPYASYITYLDELTFNGNQISTNVTKTPNASGRLYISVNSLLILKTV